MSTFNELSKRLSDAKFRKAVLVALIEHIDENFCPVGDSGPKSLLLTDEKLPVPVEMFESVVSDILSAEVEALDAEIAQINTTQLAPAKKKDAEPKPSKEKSK